MVNYTIATDNTRECGQIFEPADEINVHAIPKKHLLEADASELLQNLEEVFLIIYNNYWIITVWT